MYDNPTVTQYGALDMQVCVPSNWSDSQIVEFANKANQSGTDNGWSIRKQGDKALAGCDERVNCESRTDYVHVMLDC